jgi:hypothetical protein
MTSPASYAAASVAGLYGLTVNEWVAVGGLLLALLTFLTNVVFKWLHYRHAVALAATQKMEAPAHE